MIAGDMAWSRSGLNHWNGDVEIQSLSRILVTIAYAAKDDSNLLRCVCGWIRYASVFNDREFEKEEYQTGECIQLTCRRGSR
jgi:hypothetical protein